MCTTIISKRMKSLRLEKKISQRSLASMLEVSPAAIGMYESGSREPSIQMLCKIADLFSVDTDYLLGRSQNKRFVGDITSPEEIFSDNEGFKLMSCWAQMSASQHSEVANYAEYLLNSKSRYY